MIERVLMVLIALATFSVFAGCAQLPGTAGRIQGKVEDNLVDAAGSYFDNLTPGERQATCERVNKKLQAEKGITVILIGPGDKFPVEGRPCEKR